MNDLDKSKEELIKELKKLQQKYDSLKEISDKDITKRKQVEEELLQRENYLSALNKVKGVLISSESENPY